MKKKLQKDFLWTEKHNSAVGTKCQLLFFAKNDIRHKNSAYCYQKGKTPTNRKVRVRNLFKSGLAKIVDTVPFTIQLLNEGLVFI